MANSTEHSMTCRTGIAPEVTAGASEVSTDSEDGVTPEPVSADASEHSTNIDTGVPPKVVAADAGERSSNIENGVAAELVSADALNVDGGIRTRNTLHPCRAHQRPLPPLHQAYP